MTTMTCLAWTVQELKRKKRKKLEEKFADSSAAYVASKKYRGSHDGYVFYMGRQGLGYYKDMRPVVDEMAIDAILRASRAQQQRGGGGSLHSRRRLGVMQHRPDVFLQLRPRLLWHHTLIVWGSIV